MDKELELKQPARAPDAKAYSIEDQDPQEPEPSSVEPAPITHEAMESLLNIQKSNLNDTKLFDLLEQALNHIQCEKNPIQTDQ